MKILVTTFCPVGQASGDREAVHCRLNRMNVRLDADEVVTKSGTVKVASAGL
ncbi:hypothetical protein [Pseudomonas viridiflava]|uniref:hypothetical protein n=1 Tax=Pseudomonas viridiflava TaxID=33069 RepID=UPI0013CEA216|nr:hypothetical protein [Pseudomonas viridiflava]MBI6703070.1 hypothetical protein [Pseudomonas viridiflava]MEE4070376.1 hypothetical protein [Pseudomonas viridiflava]